MLETLFYLLRSPVLGVGIGGLQIVAQGEDWERFFFFLFLILAVSAWRRQDPWDHCCFRTRDRWNERSEFPFVSSLLESLCVGHVVSCCLVQCRATQVSGLQVISKTPCIVT